eukprot:4039920-Amphidinium_carterae.1
MHVFLYIPRFFDDADDDDVVVDDDDGDDDDDVDDDVVDDDEQFCFHPTKSHCITALAFYRLYCHTKWSLTFERF